MFWAGCRGRTVAMTEPKGLISVSGTEYLDALRCGWTIQVDPSKVNHICVAMLA